MKPITLILLSLQYLTALTIFFEVPLVEYAKKMSFSEASVSICLRKISSYPKSLVQAVKNEVSVVNAIDLMPKRKLL